MPLSFYPTPGLILVCAYDAVVVEPEMRKARPVVVIGPKLRRRGRLVTVVPLSTTAPDEPQDYHCALDLEQALPPPFDSPSMWAKCDMISTVSIDRLDRFKLLRGRHGGARQWTTGRVSEDQLRAVRTAVLCGLGLPNLTNHL